ncbi:MAG: hypothetical protein CMN39_01965 [SAR116 cluster bacterium]|nr:hypothetical protein [SAR116 cluster bacterium]
MFQLSFVRVVRADRIADDTAGRHRIFLPYLAVTSKPNGRIWGQTLLFLPFVLTFFSAVLL